MLHKDISQLIPVPQRAIIINHNTKAVTLLALISALRYANVPVLLIDCASTDGSFEFFESLLNEYDFDLMTAPLRSHGQTLDWLFNETKDEKLLLIDSDLEILSNEVINFINKHIDQQEVFGSGFLIGSTIISEAHFKGKSLEGALYFERPFMPIVLFKTDKVKQALTVGISFCEEIINNEFSLLPKRFYWQAKRFLKKGFRKRYFNSYPPKVVYDTGARMYEYLRYNQLLFFVNLPDSCHKQYVAHYHGATRRVLNPNGNLVGEDVKSGRLETVVAERLLKVYGIRNDSLIER